jgi:hypothetical protein
MEGVPSPHVCIGFLLILYTESKNPGMFRIYPFAVTYYEATKDFLVTGFTSVGHFAIPPFKCPFGY